MRQRTRYLTSLTAIRAGAISGMLLFATMLASTSAFAQNPPPVANLRGTPLARSRTPQAVVAGQAKLAGRYQAESKLRITLGLTPPKMAEEEKFLADLQDRNSPNFHKYLTPEQWNARFAPSAENEQAVVDWAQANGLTITKRFANRLVVDVEGTTQTIEKAFGVQINNYTVGDETDFSNDRDPVIPSHLTGILESVGGMNNIERVHAQHEGNIRQVSADYSPGAVVGKAETGHDDGDSVSLAKALKESEVNGNLSPQLKSQPLANGLQPNVTSGFIDPTDLYSSYGYDFNALQAQGHCCNPGHLSTGSPNTTSIGIATAGALQFSDIAGFHARYTYLAYNINTVYVDGTPACCNVETTLDTEWSMAMANSFGSYLDTSHVWVYEGANANQSTFTDIYNAMLSDGHVRIFSTSWGCAELSCTSGSTMNTDHAIFNSMLGQGWTMMAASGDSGAVDGCGNARRVDYPSSDPDFVAVGGTSLALYSDGTFYSETGWQGGTFAGACSENDGGSTGGCSAYWAAPGYQSHPYCGSGSRSVPDIALNAGYGQNVYIDGGFQGYGGTSIAAPEVAGFMAQENAYLMAIGVGCGAGYASVCAPMGEVNNSIYTEGYAIAGGSVYAPHDPFYDMVSGCNNNDITALYGTGYYCAGTGYDLVTGWGSFNALQMSWAINTYYTGDFKAPKITFSGPAVSPSVYTWFNTNQTVSWSVVDQNNGVYPSVGVAGFSQGWDTAFSDPYSEPHGGVGNSFYSGPQFPNATSGYLSLSSAGQGCHYATVDAWDNTGFATGNQYYYWLCYDTVAPSVTTLNSPAANSHGWYKQTVQVSLSSTDPGGSAASGVAATYYSIDTTACSSTTLGSCAVYTAPITISTPGYHYVAYFAKDKAGNFSVRNYDYVYIDETAPVTAAALGGTKVGSVYDTVVAVSLSATDNLSGVLSTSYQLDGGALTTYAGAISVSTLGAHTVKFYSTDYAGNVEVAKSVGFSISAPTTVAMTATPNPATNKTPVTLKAVVTAGLGATPTGTVTFYNSATAVGSAPVVAGVATLANPTLPFGNLALHAVYSGATNILGSTSAAIAETYREATVATLVSSLNPSSHDQLVTFTATVTPSVSGVPTGTVQFYNGAALIGSVALAGGKASLSTAALATGTDLIHVVYPGDATYYTSTSANLSQSVRKAVTTTTLVSSVNPAQYLQSVTFTATVSSAFGIPTGTVNFTANGAFIGSGILSGGKATFTTSNLGVVSYTIAGTYSGDTNFWNSTSAGLVEVEKLANTTTQVTASLNPTKYGQPFILAAKVLPATSGVPGGTVTFKDGATALGTSTLAAGTATLSVSSLTTGSHSITAVYNGSAGYVTSTSVALAHVVAQNATTTTLVSSLNPATAGTAVTFTATVNAAFGLPTGTVTFKDGATTIGTGTVSSAKIATFTTKTLTAATHAITAVYSGDVNDLTSTSAALSQVVH